MTREVSTHVCLEVLLEYYSFDCGYPVLLRKLETLWSTRDVPFFELPEFSSLVFWKSKKNDCAFFKIVFLEDYMFDWGYPVLIQNLTVWKIFKEADVSCIKQFT